MTETGGIVMTVAAAIVGIVVIVEAAVADDATKPSRIKRSFNRGERRERGDNRQL